LTTALEGGEGVSVTPRTFFTPGKDPVAIVQEAGWASGPVWTGAENVASTGIRSPDRPARSQSLYRLSYTAHLTPKTYSLKFKYRVIQNDCQGTIVQRQFRTKFGKQPPSDNSIRRWCAQFQETGCVCIPELKVRIRTAIETITADMRNELNFRVDHKGCTYRAPVRYVAKTWSVVLLNRKNILLSQVYCVTSC